MATLMTVGVATIAIFSLMLIWIGVDRWSNKRLGERNRCCHKFEENGGQCCGKHTGNVKFELRYSNGAPIEHPPCPHAKSE